MPEITDTINGQSFKQTLERTRQNLVYARDTFDQHWRSISDVASPRRVRLEVTDSDKGDRRWNNIINNVATKALRIAVAGMFAGNVSPARPWFALVHPNEDLMDREDVRVWLHEVERQILAVFRDSNFYTVAPVVFKDLLLFGTSVCSHVDDFKTVARFYSHPVGSYWLGQNEKLEVNQMVREFQLTIDQCVGKFGLENCSSWVKTAYDAGNYKQKVTIIHHVAPNALYEEGNPFAKGKPYMSAYYEGGAGTSNTRSASTFSSGITNDNMFLAVEGFHEQPFYAPRWEVAGEDVYATECPGMVALGDIKQLQMQERRKGQAIDKQVNPPLQGPASLGNIGINSLPGGINAFETGSDQRGITTLYQVDLNLRDLREDMQAVEARIEDAFFVNMFLAITNMQGVQPRNEYELIQRNDEKLLQLGPVLQRVQNEFLSMAVDRVFNQLVRADDNGQNGVLPRPPEALEESSLEIQYISSLAQAQRAVATQGLDRTFAFAAQLGQVKPDALDKINGDWMIEEYARSTGTSPKAIVPDEQVAQARQERQQLQAQQLEAQIAAQQGAAARDTAQAERTASETDG